MSKSIVNDVQFLRRKKMKSNIIKLFGLGFVTMAAFTACNDEVTNFDNVSPEIYNYAEGIDARVQDVYSWCLPDANAEASWKYNCTGLDDSQSKSTEEYAGFGTFVDPTSILSSNDAGSMVPDYYHNTSTNIQASVWGRIRNINDVIEGIESHDADEDSKNKGLGQMYFFRAWCYYQLVKWYGGVPIVKEVQAPVSESFTQRSSAKECFDFILEDLDNAARLLAPYTMSGQWSSGSNWGRVTTGTALALKGRVLNLWASPLFNRSNDPARWQNAYEQQLRELDSIKACGYDLYMGSGENINGSAFGQIFTQTQTCEDVMVTLYNTVSAGDGQKNNNYERYIRPSNSGTGSTGKQPSAMFVDMFPMADGKIPAGTGTYTKLATSDSTYDSSCPFYGRDPRFYRTFAFPGFRWAFVGNASTVNANNPSDGENYALWNYVWYTDVNDQGDPESGNSYGGDNLLDGKRGVYVRKRSDDNDLGQTSLYSYSLGFSLCAAPYIEIRFAEVLLNLAEAAAGSGNLDKAVELLKLIRARAGYTSDNNYGLQEDMSADEAICMSAVLYERQIELAYEGKRFDDLRRWLLFDGGATINSDNIEGCPSDWVLTGWGGNTCDWLGFKALNGQRRETMEFRLADKYGLGSTTLLSDPLFVAAVDTFAARNEMTSADVMAKVNSGEDKYSYYDIVSCIRPAALDFRKSLEGQQDQLRAWYKENLVRKEKKGDAYNSDKSKLYMYFHPKYYFLGFTHGAMNNDTGIYQTIGWMDTNENTMGTFDPLAE